MKRSSYILILLTFIALPGLGQTSFRYKRNIDGVKEAGWYALLLPSGIFKNLNDDLGDVRLYSLEGKDTVELPYLIDIRHDEATRKEVQLPVFNKSTKDGELFVTFALQPAQKVNSIALEFDQLNYFAFVTLEGSDDKTQWYEIVRDRRIVSIRNEKGDYALSDITFPLTDYRFLRVRIKSDILLTFRRATFQYHDVKRGVYQDVPLSWKMQQDKRTRQSFVNIKLDELVPVSSIDVKADSTRDYYRRFRIEYVRDSTRTDKGWLKYYSPLYEGYLTSFKPNVFDFDWQVAGEIRLVITDQDNAPLKIREVAAKGPEVRVISWLKPGMNMMLYGVQALRAPSYDLAYFENKIPDAPLRASLSPEEKLTPDHPAAKPLFENKLWLWSIMLVMIAGLGFFTLKMMKPGAVDRP